MGFQNVSRSFSNHLFVAASLMNFNCKPEQSIAIFCTCFGITLGWIAWFILQGKVGFVVKPLYYIGDQAYFYAKSLSSGPSGPF